MHSQRSMCTSSRVPRPRRKELPGCVVPRACGSGVFSACLPSAGTWFPSDEASRSVTDLARAHSWSDFAEKGRLRVPWETDGERPAFLQRHLLVRPSAPHSQHPTKWPLHLPVTRQEVVLWYGPGGFFTEPGMGIQAALGCSRLRRGRRT